MSSEITYQQNPDSRPSVVTKQDIEEAFIGTLRDLKLTDRAGMRNRASLEANFRQKFEALNRIKLTDAQFQHLTDTAEGQS